MAKKTNNEVIANFMGYEKVHCGYFGDKYSETKWQRENELWLYKVGLTEVGNYAVNMKANKWHPWEDMAYHRSWSLLMEVVTKIIKLGYSFVLNSDEEINSCYFYRPGSKDFHEKTSPRVFDSPIKSIYNSVICFLLVYNTNPKFYGKPGRNIRKK